MFGRKKIKSLEESKVKLLNAIERYRVQRDVLEDKLDVANELKEYYRIRCKELRTELHEIKIPKQ